MKRVHSTKALQSNKNKKLKKTANQENEEDIEHSVVVYERWNYDRLQHIIEIEDIEPSIEAQCRLILKTGAQVGRRRVVYTPREYRNGRKYANEASAQSMKNCIQRLCLDEIYVDIDFVNCGPTILAQIFEKHLGSAPTILKQYVNNRQSMIMEFTKERTEFNDIPYKQAKYIFLTCIHGGCTYINGVNSLLLSTFQNEIHNSARQLKKQNSHYKSLYAWVKEQKEHKYSKLGSFISCCWQEIENIMLMSAYTYMTTIAGRTVGSLNFDGLKIEKQPDKPITQDILNMCESYIFKETGYNIKICIKPMSPTADDMKWFWGPKALHKIACKFERQIYCLIRHGQVNTLKRQNDFIMQPHDTIPGVYTQTLSSSEYINHVLSKHVTLFRAPDMKKLLINMNTVNHQQFELLNDQSFQKHVISFYDGYFDIDKVKIIEWENAHQNEHIPMTEHYFECKYPLDFKDETKTPIWNKLLTGQLSPEMCEQFEMFVGRLFFDIGAHDHWQVIPMLKGMSNTGKSTALSIIQHMFPISKCGVITSTHEEKFGLESLYTKRIVFVPDICENFRSCLNQQDFQSMATGESVNIARKNKTAVSLSKWTTPMIIAGNFLPNYKNKSGSFSKRMCVFMFSNIIPQYDTELKTKVIQNELAHITIRCIVKYREACTTFESKEFWRHVACQELKDQQIEVQQESSYLTMFLRHGNDYYQVLHDEKSVTSLQDLNSAFSNYMRFVHKITRSNIGTDYHPIKSMGFIIETINLCKTCNQKCSKAMCGSHYNAKNRYQRKMIQGMRLVRKKNMNELASLLR